MNKKTNLATSPPPVTNHLANERTFLAWIRTSLAIMAFGFIIERFSFFMQSLVHLLTIQNPEIGSVLSSLSSKKPSLFGTFIIVFGLLIGLFSFFQYKKAQRQIESNHYYHSSLLALIVVSLIVVVGIGLIIYLISSF